MYKRRRKAAVAIRYEPGSYAPYVLARGYDRRAEDIIGLARQSGVPLHQDEALAQALAGLDPGAFIPRDLWELTARVLLAIKDMHV